MEGLKPVQLLFAYNNYGAPETLYPMIPLNWNRFYKLNEATGELIAEGCAYPCSTCFLVASCACFSQGIYFRSVTPPCNILPCGIIQMPGMPKTDNNSPENKWSQTAAAASRIPVVFQFTFFTACLGGVAGNDLNNIFESDFQEALQMPCLEMPPFPF